MEDNLSFINNYIA